MKKNGEGTEIEVWLIEDNRTYGTTVVRVLNQSKGMYCPRTFWNCEDAIFALRSGGAPEVVLVDVGLPGMNGIEGISEIKEINPDVLLIVLTVFEDEEKVFRAICAGASGYLLKASPVETIASGIREVTMGGAPMNGRIARMVLRMFSLLKLKPSGKVERETNYGLTLREHEILQLMADGLIKKEIADQLSVSFHTVDSHLRNIYTKLQVNTQTGAVVKAMREGLVK